MTHTEFAQHEQEVSMLRSELEILMNERQSLLRVTGAAAVFVANLDSKRLPENTYNSAEVLGESLNALGDDTLKDALEVIRAEINVSTGGISSQSS